MPVQKLSISLTPDVASSVAASAHDRGESVSAWMERAARDALRIEAGLSAVDDFERDHGRLTASELAAADRMLDEDLGADRARRS